MRSLLAGSVLLISVALADPPKLPGVGAALQRQVDQNQIAGAVTLVVAPEKVLHLEATGWANRESQKPMAADSVFWIASMSKPITAAAVLMLQDEGKLNVNDPVSKYLPEFAGLRTPAGQPATMTISQLLTHTSGLGEAGPKDAEAWTLTDLVPLWVSAPMKYEPGARWQYTQSGINAAGRIVEVVSGLPFDQFLQDRLFTPLGMKDTTFYPGPEQWARWAEAYVRNAQTGQLEAVPPRPEFGPRHRPPQGNGGLYSTAADYGRFCQMLLQGGQFVGKRYLSPKAMTYLTQSQTGELPTGFFQNETFGNRGLNYGWALGTCVLKTPHDGVAAKLSAGTYGHGGAWGTQAWIDPVRGVAYILMVQRANFPNSDASDVRREFQQAAAEALGW